jgi:hypothetical protein
MLLIKHLRSDAWKRAQRGALSTEPYSCVVENDLGRVESKKVSLTVPGECGEVWCGEVWCGVVWCGACPTFINPPFCPSSNASPSLFAESLQELVFHLESELKRAGDWATAQFPASPLQMPTLQTLLPLPNLPPRGPPIAPSPSGLGV